MPCPRNDSAGHFRALTNVDVCLTTHGPARLSELFNEWRPVTLDEADDGASRMDEDCAEDGSEDGSEEEAGGGGEGDDEGWVDPNDDQFSHVYIVILTVAALHNPFGEAQSERLDADDLSDGRAS